MVSSTDTEDAHAKLTHLAIDLALNARPSCAESFPSLFCRCFHHKYICVRGYGYMLNMMMAGDTKCSSTHFSINHIVKPAQNMCSGEYLPVNSLCFPLTCRKKHVISIDHFVDL